MLERIRDESGQTMAEYAVVLGVSTAIQNTLLNVIASM